MAAKKKAVKSALPAGFVRKGGGDKHPAHDFRVAGCDVFQGVVVEMKTVTQTKKQKDPKTKKEKLVEVETPVMICAESGTGELKSIWHSHAMTEVFDDAKIGDEVYFRFVGQKKTKGGNRFNEFECGLKPKGKAKK